MVCARMEKLIPGRKQQAEDLLKYQVLMGCGKFVENKMRNPTYWPDHAFERKTFR